MRALLFILKLLLKIAVAPVILVLTVFIWLCAGLVYVSGLVLGLPHTSSADTDPNISFEINGPSI